MHALCGPVYHLPGLMDKVQLPSKEGFIIKSFKSKFVCILAFATWVGLSIMPAFAEDDVVVDTALLHGVASLPPRAKMSLKGLPAEFAAYRFNYKGARCVLIVIAARSKYVLAPAIIDKTAPTSTIAGASKAVVAVNGGYFNLSDGESASYMVLDTKAVLDPRLNKALTSNPKLAPFLPQIFNRSELRVYQDRAGHRQYAIERHQHTVPAGLKLLHALQGGPRLLPELTSVEEAFVRTEADGKQVDSIGVNRTAARTAIALSASGDKMIISCAGKGQDEFSSGLTLPDLASLLKSLGAVDALNFDGGTSTTLVVKNADVKPGAAGHYEMLIGRQPETRVRSILSVGKR